MSLPKPVTPNGIPVDLTIRAYRSYKGDIESGIRGSITMKHPDQARPRAIRLPSSIDEYVVDEKLLPLEIEGTDEAGRSPNAECV